MAALHDWLLCVTSPLSPQSGGSRVTGSYIENGVWPSFLTELEKEAYTIGGLPFDWHIRKIAARDYGPRNAGAALAAWRGFSEAVRDMPPTYENQYGPFRMGPACPFNAFGPEVKPSDFPLPPMYLGS